MKRWLVASMVGLALAGCAASRPDRQGPAPLPIPVEVDSVRYETSPCFGACPVYAVTAQANGEGTFIGKRFTAVAGERRFKLSEAQYAAFVERLAPYRPASGEVRYAPGEPNCANAPTDMPGVDVTWTRSLGDSQALHFYLGCRRDNPALAEAVAGAIELLPIQELIGARP